MSRFFSSDVRVYHGTYELGTAMTRIMFAMQLEALDQTAFGDAAERMLAGQRKDGLELGGLFDDSTAFDAAAAALLGSGTRLVTMLIGSGTGSRSFNTWAELLAAKPAAQMGQLVAQETRYQPNQEVKPGVLLFNRAAVAGTATGGGVNQAGSGTTTAGGTMFAHVFSVTAGTGSLLIEEGPDGVSWNPVGTLSVAAATGTQLAVGSGTTIRQWVRFRSTGTGTYNAAVFWSRGT